MKQVMIEANCGTDPVEAKDLRSPAQRKPPGLRHGKARSPEALEIGQVVARLRPKLEAAALRMTREPEAASDVVQQATLKAIRFRHQFRGGAALSTWIYRIVINEALMWSRGQRRRASALERFEREMPDLQGSHTTAPDELLDQRRRLAAVAKGLERLGARDRQVLVEAFTSAHASRDPVARLGIPRTALRTRVFRARKRLLRLIESA
jgi:RNA polymerase sigma-70 factor (ECF subfamily)